MRSFVGSLCKVLQQLRLGPVQANEPRTVGDRDPTVGLIPHCLQGLQRQKAGIRTAATSGTQTLPWDAGIPSGLPIIKPNACSGV